MYPMNAAALGGKPDTRPAGRPSSRIFAIAAALSPQAAFRLFTIEFRTIQLMGQLHSLRRGLHPHEAHVMHVRHDRRDRPPLSAGRLGLG
jgi:hypothetical protein